MGIKVIASNAVKLGWVRVLEDGVLVADGPLHALRRDDGPEPDNIEIYAHPADVIILMRLCGHGGSVH